MDEEVDKEKKEDKVIEDKVRAEIAKRRKERCKKRGSNIHDQQDIIDNNKAKKRKLDDEGRYKVVMRIEKTQREEEILRTDNTSSKRARQDPEETHTAPKKILGAVEKNMILEEKIDWEKRREEILENLRKDEEERENRIRKAKNLEKSWELMRECRKFLQYNEK